ncbi:ankyrin repeat and btb poz domain containing protein [Niveomyces insectorum RCEF 264]|uniref:Ankyrin repeat and btb poz domain containing protein n=1 Tax=Niveomyces insectorum RCEF 264 TaxID=1081102 RepID=A0A167UI79_9HYPO|nr:ankyrin repeat and btb poz domain containing protein [Niveomyces insectorum RCEF 264]
MAAMPKAQLEAKLKEEHELINRGVLREENPLDLSEDFNQFLEACRRGDLKQCQKYILAGVNINGKDAYDYTPLIVASLCGHYEVAQLLLESGALAERNTFQGERCLYNALNDRIRNLLLQYDYAKSADPLQPWSSHITSLLARQVPKTSDITLTASAGPGLVGEAFQLHKFLLAARTPYFHRKLTEAPDMATWKLSNHVPAAAFRIVLHYLYLDDLTPHTTALSNEEELFRGIDKISKHLGVEQLWEAMLAGSDDRRLARQRYQDEVERAQRQIESFFRQHVLGNKMVVETSKVADVKWPHDNFIFADCLLCADEMAEDEDEGTVDGVRADNGIPVGPSAPVARRMETPTTSAITTTTNNNADAAPSSSSLSSSLPSHAADATQTGPQRNDTRRPRRSVLYPAHKALLVRSAYFETMFSSAFLEAQESTHLRVIAVDCAPDVLEIVLSFLYTEQADIPLDRALDVLYVADMMFLDKLKTKAAVIISTLGSGNRNVLQDPTRGNGNGNGDGTGGGGDEYDIDIYEVVRAAWDLRVQRLEEFAARFLAQRLEHYIDEPAFADLVLESAHRLKSRQETDSIELIDDIRYFLSERFRLRFEDMALSDIIEEEEGEPGKAPEEQQQQQQQQGGDGVAVGAKEGPAGKPNGEIQPAATPPPAVATLNGAAATEALGSGGVLRTLDGELAEDEFDSDALNYQILLVKIDKLLERLGLDG